jgi:SAM-dependent methyltransferase
MMPRLYLFNIILLLLCMVFVSTKEGSNSSPNIDGYVHCPTDYLLQRYNILPKDIVFKSNSFDTLRNQSINDLLLVFPPFIRQIFINRPQQDYQQPLHILDIGCGNGHTIGDFQYLFPNARTFGINLLGYQKNQVESQRQFIISQLSAQEHIRCLQRTLEPSLPQFLLLKKGIGLERLPFQLHRFDLIYSVFTLTAGKSKRTISYFLISNISYLYIGNLEASLIAPALADILYLLKQNGIALLFPPLSFQTTFQSHRTFHPLYTRFFPSNTSIPAMKNRFFILKATTIALTAHHIYSIIVYSTPKLAELGMIVKRCDPLQYHHPPSSSTTAVSSASKYGCFVQSAQSRSESHSSSAGRGDNSRGGASHRHHHSTTSTPKHQQPPQKNIHNSSDSLNEQRESNTSTDSLSHSQYDTTWQTTFFPALSTETLDTFTNRSLESMFTALMKDAIREMSHSKLSFHPHYLLTHPAKPHHLTSTTTVSPTTSSLSVLQVRGGHEISMPISAATISIFAGNLCRDESTFASCLSAVRQFQHYMLWLDQAQLRTQQVMSSKSSSLISSSTSSSSSSSKATKVSSSQ